MFCFDLNLHFTIDLCMMTSICMHVLCGIVNCMVFLYILYICILYIVCLLYLIINCNSSFVDVRGNVHTQSSYLKIITHLFLPFNAFNFFLVGTLTFLFAPFLIAERKALISPLNMMHAVDIA